MQKTHILGDYQKQELFDVTHLVKPVVLGLDRGAPGLVIPDNIKQQ